MLFFFAPFFWMLAIPAIFALVLVVRALFWLNSLTRRDAHRPTRRDQPFIESQFVEDDDPDKMEDPSDR